MNPELKYRTVGRCDIEIPDPCGLVIFGASGDLSKRKLIPSLYRLYKNRLLPESFYILGIGRTKMGLDQFREAMLVAVTEVSRKDFDYTSWLEFTSRLYYLSLDYALHDSYQTLREDLVSLENKYRTGKNRIYYLAVPPTTFETIIVNLGVAGLSDEETSSAHIVVEKPFGRDLDSARKLNRLLKQFFKERDIFRIDHFLAKETVQNIVMFRFANSIFEPLWNNKYIDHVQITASETLGVEHRAGYYDEAGVIRDMFPNHLFQLLAITAMEPPPLFESEMVRDEKVKVFRSIRPIPLDRLDEYVVIGQYGSGKVNGKDVVGYREESGVSPKSETPTFAAMKIFIDNWRWRGVPFYIRSGKRLSGRKTEIAIFFKPVPHLMFEELIEEPITPNVLVIRVQPEEGISLSLQTKLPGSKVCLTPVSMDFSYPVDIQLDAYEWVLLDCMRGDQMLFVREDGVELTWSLLTPVIERLESTGVAERFSDYTAGSSGPDEAALLIERDDRAWRPL
ncbi:MAG: glucose-6-phosphate dehydrogenase [Nitrospirae bacterium]|nr:glucose-6-phosphate dehydrogenase [Nitrospirota bacterium]